MKSSHLSGPSSPVLLLVEEVGSGSSWVVVPGSPVLVPSSSVVGGRMLVITSEAASLSLSALPSGQADKRSANQAMDRSERGMTGQYPPPHDQLRVA
ncbi:hypothetical protein OV079_08370 [Nannocystis pusilla]|uniref:Uncharacterized protein n=1 Tax=Nannocystis pusilla TaxID=889268 RepID=A0A9X3EKZ6_9BACT|nr:hypothetical protein [Nannocystis pusilla]MCY1005581.1 hypothetical protein [Nannocystis pusilla]